MVQLECGPDTAVLQAIENGRCFYEFTLQTPAACDPAELDRLTEQIAADRRTFRVFQRPESSTGHDDL